MPRGKGTSRGGSISIALRCPALLPVLSKQVIKYYRDPLPEVGPQPALGFGQVSFHDDDG